MCWVRLRDQQSHELRVLVCLSMRNVLKLGEVSDMGLHRAQLLHWVADMQCV